MVSGVHGQRCPWSAVSMVSGVNGQRCPWSAVSMVNVFSAKMEADFDCGCSSPGIQFKAPSSGNFFRQSSFPCRLP
ncbi:MAG: hypothetical protein BJ554DRAFT_2602 [Olpidium bornovanus]|uniref:Uncharacterized protein n=1 Tax=Olpidium bornovanus TaxID=278681 RepID=A0A8H7ZQS3_9FUNG|nr:MAG: hypothetical protein BJ554DRAFT_2602 [Olpidium bornovanus]